MKLEVIDGPNFSGRTDYLRRWVGLSTDNGHTTTTSAAYIGPDTVAAFSGIAPTVAAELELMASDKAMARAGKVALEDMGFGYCLERNPFTLSGGEQVVAAIVVAVAGQPERLAIDCGLEQLSAETRSAVLQYLSQQEGNLTIADNRLSEWYEGPVKKFCMTPTGQLEPKENAAQAVPVHGERAEIQLVDLGHAYVKGRKVFDGLNVTFQAGIPYLLRGRNGSGKTTLSKILCGLIRPTTGEIRVNGKRVEPWRTPGLHVAYHFQNPDYQMFSTRVEDQLGAEISTRSAMSSYFGLQHLMKEHPLDLPYVYKKRVAIASAFSRRTSRVILDEPTIGQDATFVSLLISDKFQADYVVISHSRCFSGISEISLH